ncbi:MAG: energy transducer TonB [Blastocatellia bacterium]
MRLTRLLVKSFLTVAIIAQFFLFTAESVRGQDPQPEPPKIIRKSGGVLQNSALSRVEPAYPPLAKASGVSGSVVVEITVDEEGKVIAARAISGHPLLKDAAVSAARQWTFTPTMLSGVPVKVIGTITFNFNLDEPPAQSDSPPAGVPGGVPGSIPGSIVRTPIYAPARQADVRMATSPEELLAIIEQSGYRYAKVSEGVWEIEATGKNTKDFRIRATMAEALVLLMVKLADRKDVSVKNELLLKLLEMNHRFDMARVALSDEMLYARIDLHARVVDGKEFNYAVEQLASATNEIYPELKSFISSIQTLPDVASKPEDVIKQPVQPSPSQPPAIGSAANPPAISVDSKPVALNSPKPNYTREARRNGVQGLVRLRLLVGSDGKIKKVKVLQTLPDGLEQEAIKAAYKIKFKPAMKNGQPVSYWVGVDVEFNLRDNPNQ